MERNDRYESLADYEALFNARDDRQEDFGDYGDIAANDDIYDCGPMASDEEPGSNSENAEAPDMALRGAVTHLKELPESTLVISAKMRRLDSDGHEALSMAMVDGTGTKIMECLVKPKNFEAVAELTGYSWSSEEDADEFIGRIDSAQLVAGYEMEPIEELLASQGLSIAPISWMNVREEWTRLQIERGKMDGTEPKVRLIICALKNHYNAQIVTALDEATATQHIMADVIKENVNSEKDERHAIRVYCFFALAAAFFSVVFMVRGEWLVTLLCALIAVYLLSMLPNLRRKRQNAPAVEASRF